MRWGTVLALALLAVLVLGAQLVWAQAEPAPSDESSKDNTELPSGAGLFGPGKTPPTVKKIVFRGNRKVEDDAIRVNLTTAVGAPLDREKLREDIRALWKLGFFEDVKVHGEPASGGGIIVTYVLTEKSSIRKILVQGNDELGLDKINEVIDLKRDSVLDITKIKKNTQKIKELYISKGFYLATVDYQVRPVSESEVDVWLTVQENAKVQIRRISFTGNEKVNAEELRSVMGTQEGGFFSFINDSGTFQQEMFERDLTLITAYYYDNGFVTVKVGTPQITLSADKRYMFINIPIEEGPVFDIGKMDFKGDLMKPKKDYYTMLETKQGTTF